MNTKNHIDNMYVKILSAELLLYLPLSVIKSAKLTNI